MYFPNEFLNIPDWSMFKLTGPDTERFLNGQFTNDVLALKDEEVQLTARVSRTGGLSFYGYLLRNKESEYYILCPVSFLKSFVEDLEKFIIMDDVEIESEGLSFSVKFNLDKISEKDIKINFLGNPAILKLEKSELVIDETLLCSLKFNFGLPSENRLGSEDLLVNQTVLIDRGTSHDKGCYVGQETVRKIENNRGAGRKDILIEVRSSSFEALESIEIEEDTYEVLASRKEDNHCYFLISGKRKLRVEGKKLHCNSGGKLTELVVHNLPLIEKTFESKAIEVFEQGISLFTEDKDDQARALLEKAYYLDPKNPEIIESYGALEGRLGNFDKAIKLMDKLEEVDPSSVMACTNRSLYFMKLGEIEKAEEEKSKATVKGFENTAASSAEAKARKKEDQLRRLGMYEQVLEIDPGDSMANEGAAQIYFDTGDIEKSDKHIDVLLSKNNKNIKAMSIKAKILVLKGETSAAKELIKDTSDIASEKGDFLLANEMQSLLSSLETPS